MDLTENPLTAALTNGPGVSLGAGLMGGREDRQRVRFEAFVDPSQADAVVELLEAFGARPTAPGDMGRGVQDPALVEELCEVMHDAYERAAVGAGWETNPASRKPWADVPESNKATMRASVSALLSHLGWKAP